MSNFFEESNTQFMQRVSRGELDEVIRLGVQLRDARVTILASLSAEDKLSEEMLSIAYGRWFKKVLVQAYDTGWNDAHNEMGERK